MNLGCVKYKDQSDFGKLSRAGLRNRLHKEEVCTSALAAERSTQSEYHVPYFTQSEYHVPYFTYNAYIANALKCFCIYDLFLLINYIEKVDWLSASSKMECPQK